ncbi:transcriptional regulator [Cytophagales bacterium WSM2-2]|nr:transcriptional regulator [Cytophagales bacterium WSM2-2]
MKSIEKRSELLRLETLNSENSNLVEEQTPDTFGILWFKDQSILTINGKRLLFERDQVVFVTEFQSARVESLSDARFIQFKHPFCCIKTLEKELGLTGLLYNQEATVVSIADEQLVQMEFLWNNLNEELQTNDQFQADVLEIMIKRLLIFCSGLLRTQHHQKETSFRGVIGEFYHQVELNFRNLHMVNDYAKILNKSPKTLSGIFSSSKHKSPSQIIQERILLQARRLLLQTDMPVKEVAYEVGYEDIQSFSRFFKSKVGVGPREFRHSEKMTTH